MYSANEATHTISWLLSEKFNEAGDDRGGCECRSEGERGLFPAETVAAEEETGGISEANEDSLANKGAPAFFLFFFNTRGEKKSPGVQEVQILFSSFFFLSFFGAIEFHRRKSTIREREKEEIKKKISSI